MFDLALKPFHSDIYFRSQYIRGSLTLVTSFFSILEKLLISFQGFGTSLKDVRIDGGGAGFTDLHLFCGLPKISTVIRFYLDRLEIDFKQFNQIGEETAVEITQRAWATVHEADANISILHHEVTADVQAELVGGSTKEFIERFVHVPPPFGDQATSAVIFNMGAGVGGGDVLWSRIVLDRSLAREGAFFLKVAARFDGASVSFEKIGERTTSFFAAALEQLGLKAE